MESHAAQITVAAGPDTAHVTIEGDLDLTARPDAEATLTHLDMIGVRDVVVDVARLRHLDSTGASLLLALAHQVRQRGGAVRLVGASERVVFMLDVRGGLDLFGDVDSRRRNARA